MADDKKKQPIIIKRKKAGHGAAHGGAWKVAYADFVTAMMSFFLVMWLLGSDEETKASVAEYFNNPTSAWRKDLTDKDTPPLGDMTGAGEELLRGAEGQVPEDLVQRPSRVAKTPKEDATELLDQLIRDKNLLALESLKFSIAEEDLFVAGTLNQWTPKAERLLSKLGALTRAHQGSLTIKGSYDGRAPASEGGGYEFQLSRTVLIAKHMVDAQYASEDNVTTIVAPVGARYRDADGQVEKASGRRIEFTLTR